MSANETRYEFSHKHKTSILCYLNPRGADWDINITLLGNHRDPTKSVFSYNVGFKTLLINVDTEHAKSTISRR